MIHFAYIEGNIEVGTVTVTRFAAFWKVIQLNQTANSDVGYSSICWFMYFVYM